MPPTPLEPAPPAPPNLCTPGAAGPGPERVPVGVERDETADEALHDELRPAIPVEIRGGDVARGGDLLFNAGRAPEL